MRGFERLFFASSLVVCTGRVALVLCFLGATLDTSGGNAFILPTVPWQFPSPRGLLLYEHSAPPPSRRWPFQSIVSAANSFGRGGSSSSSSSSGSGSATTKPSRQLFNSAAARPQSRGRSAFLCLQAAKQTPAGGSAAPAEKGPLTKKARVTVRRATKADYEGVAAIREVIVPVGMSGATGFLGSKVVIDDPAEAKRRVLMAKVADLVSGKAVALIALEGGRIVGTVDCAIQLAITIDAAKQEDKLGQSNMPKNNAAAAVGRRRHQQQQRPPSPPQSQVFLKNLFVLPDERRRGIGRELIKGAEAFGRKERAGGVCLEVARKNAVAKDLYYSCGFEDVEPSEQAGGGWGAKLVKSLGLGKSYMTKNI